MKAFTANFENHEHLKYLKNVYCVVTNHIAEQDVQVNHKLIIIIDIINYIFRIIAQVIIEMHAL